jgi:hypothetical protein
MKNIVTYAFVSFLFGFLPNISFGQTVYSNLFYTSSTATVYVQGGALLHVQGDVNNNGGTITNDGVLNVEGNIANAGTFTTDVSVIEGTVRLVGNATVSGTASAQTQTISGTSPTFYNLVIDQAAAGDLVSLSTPITVSNALVWGYNTPATGYPSTTSSILTSTSLMKVQGASSPPSGNGIIQMYNGSTDNGITLSKAATSSNTIINGYQAVGTYNYSSSPAAGTNDKYIQSRGTDPTTNTGLTMTINDAGTYTFPVGSPNKYYQPIQLYFPSVQSGLKLTAKFTESTTLTGTSGSYQSVFGSEIDQSHSTFTTAQTSWYNNPTNTAQINAALVVNPGYNVYQADCEGNSKWFIMNSFITNHGYWSINPTSGTLNGNYTVQTFPHSYTDPGHNENKRTVMEGSEAFNVLATGTSFNSAMEAATPNLNAPTTDILHYSYLGTSRGNFTSTACANDATGIPGGAYKALTGITSTGFGHYAVGSPSNNTSQALPIDLISLTADPIDNAYIRVNWATASEQDNKGFEVERSTDGSNFTNIGWVAGNGTSDEQHNYLYNDQTVKPDQTYYYRLNQVNNDGTGKLTYIVSAEITDGPGVTVSEWIPNPTSGSARLVVSTTEAQPVHVKIYDIIGKLVIDSENQVAFGTNTFDFDLSALTDGTYAANIQIGNNVYSKKVVLVK